MRLSLFILFLSASLALADDYSNGFSGAASIVVHQAVSGFIDYGGDLDYFQIILLASRTYQITMESSSFDNHLKLFSPTFTLLASVDDAIGYNAQITVSTSMAGGYYIEAAALSSSTTGSYSLGVVDRTPCSAACTDCKTRAPPCGICSSGYICNACSNSPSPVGIGGACYCVPSQVYISGVCSTCDAFMSNCIQCTSSASCQRCSGSYLAYGSSCVYNCPSGTFSTGVICQACSTLHGSCATCNGTSTCTSCSGGLVALGSVCAGSCPSDTYNNNGLCTSCKTLDNYCTSCNGSITCTGCSNSKFALGSSCVGSCPGNTYVDNGICTSCSTLDAYCTRCNGTMTCAGCSGSKYALASTCVNNCPADTYINSGICTSCKTLNDYCISCNSSLSCTGCSNSKFALGPTCVDSCPLGTYENKGICTSCKTLDSSCRYCNSSLSCTGCDGGLFALGPSCVAKCPSTTYINSGICTSCVTLDNNCISCNSSISCLGCSGGLVAFGSSCIFACPVGTYENNGLCTSCRTLDDDCAECSNNRFCSLCDFQKKVLGSNCVSSCPSDTKDTERICSNTAYKITLGYTDSVTSYLVQFPPALVYDVNVPLVSTVTLEGLAPSQYNYTLAKRGDTLYQIDFQFAKSIPSTTITLRYTLNGSPPSSNVLIGRWIGQITSKYIAYMPEGDRAAVKAINSVVGGAITGATSGAGSVALLGGNPALLWPLLNLFQAFYYLIFIDVNYPANVQMFLKIFSLGSMGFLPNPLEWFMHDIDSYNLAVPKRYNDYNFSGLFLDNSGNELLLLFFVIGFYLVSKIIKKWIRRTPTSVRLLTDKTVGWFEWSGILRSLITSYTDMAQAVFLQMKVLSFYSTAFMLSSMLAFVALGFVILFPVIIFMIVKKFDDHPELLCLKYETLVKEYDIKKKSGRHFIATWLVRRLIMCLSLVFLQGHPYAQISVLCVLVIATIYHSWSYAPYPTKKENICNTIIEILFGVIHGVIFVLIYDDRNLYFSDKQRLQMGWVIIFACGVILLISVGLSLTEQVKEVIRGIKLLKKLLSKPQKNKRKNLKKQIEVITVDQNSTLADKSQLFALNRTQLDNIEEFPPTSESLMNKKARNLQIPLSRVREMRRARIASKIRHLRKINS